MSFSVDMGQAAGETGAAIAIKHGHKLIDKLGVPRLSQDEIDEYSRRKFPKYFQKLIILQGIAFITLPVLGTLLTVFFWEQIQMLLFGKEALYFSTGISGGAFAVFNFLGLIFLSGYLLGLIIDVFATQRFKDYVMQLNIKGGYPFKSKEFDRMLVKFAILYYLIVSPILYVSLIDYTALYSDHIIYSFFPSLVRHTYPLESINNLELSPRTKEDDNDRLFVVLVASFKFKDGKQISNRVSMDQIYDLEKNANSLNISITKTGPSLSVLRLIDEEDSDYQTRFHNFFGVSTPVNLYY